MVPKIKLLLFAYIILISNFEISLPILDKEIISDTSYLLSFFILFWRIKLFISFEIFILTLSTSKN